MRYRRLGRTDVMVSEVGLEVRDALDAGGEEGATTTLRAAIDAGITVMAWDVSDAAEDVEPLIIRAAGVDRGRLTLVAVLDYLPPPSEVGPQIEAIASRLAEPDAPGYLDVIALPGVPDAAQAAALEEARARGIVRFVGVAAEMDAGLPSPLPEVVDLLVLSGAPSSGLADGANLGVIARASEAGVSPLLEGAAVHCVATAAREPSDVARLAIPVI